MKSVQHDDLFLYTVRISLPGRHHLTTVAPAQQPDGHVSTLRKSSALFGELFRPPTPPSSSPPLFSPPVCLQFHTRLRGTSVLYPINSSTPACYPCLLSHPTVATGLLGGELFSFKHIPLTRSHARTHTHLHTRPPACTCTHTHARTHTHTPARVRVRTHRHTHTHTLSHACTHSHTHTCT